MKKIFINFIRKVHKNLSFKLNNSRNLRKLIYKLYEIIRLVEFRIKSFLFKESTLNNIIYVNPEKIVHQKNLTKGNWLLILKFIRPLFNLRINNSVHIINGEWDLKENLQIFNEDIKYLSYYQHFIKGIEWEDTNYYKREKSRYLNGKIRKEYKSVEDLNLKYKYLDILYRKIEKEGFKTQREIMESEGLLANYGRGFIARKPDDDITVAIGRNGEAIFLDGRHRLNIAKMLNLKTKIPKRIPVRVLVVHKKYISNLEKKRRLS